MDMPEVPKNCTHRHPKASVQIDQDGPLFHATCKRCCIMMMRCLLSASPYLLTTWTMSMCRSNTGISTPKMGQARVARSCSARRFRRTRSRA